MNKGFIDWLKRESPDVICLQEIKANKEQVEISEIENLGYNTFWFSAQKKGYSGVAIFSKQKPNHVEYGSGIDYMDFEGRIIRLDFDKVSIISLYLPSGTNLDRLDFKFKFMDDFKDYIYQLNNEIKNLVICGDYNICHKAIDIHDPIRNKNVSGFLPEEREWLEKIKTWGFFDSYRKFFPDSNDKFSWFDYRSRGFDDNPKRGLRIDHLWVTKPLLDMAIESEIDYEIRGMEKPSDHAPVWTEFKI